MSVNSKVTRQVTNPEIPFDKTLEDLLDYWRGRMKA